MNGGSIWLSESMKCEISGNFVKPILYNEKIQISLETLGKKLPHHHPPMEEFQAGSQVSDHHCHICQSYFDWVGYHWHPSVAAMLMLRSQHGPWRAASGAGRSVAGARRWRPRSHRQGPWCEHWPHKPYCSPHPLSGRQAAPGNMMHA